MRSALFLLGYLAIGGLALDARDHTKSHASHSGSASGSASHSKQPKSQSASRSASGSAHSYSEPPPLTVKAATTLNLFLGPGGDNDIQWEASVAGVSGCTTTLALECNVGQACQKPISATLTYGNNEYAINTVRSGSGAVETVHETCKLAGSTVAACAATITLQSGKSTIHTSSTKTFSGNAVLFQSVPVTGGASLLTSAAGCSSQETGSASSASRTSGGSGLPTSIVNSQSAQTLSTTSSHSGAQPSAISQVYKILVVPGAAALLAGAFV